MAAALAKRPFFFINHRPRLCNHVAWFSLQSAATARYNARMIEHQAQHLAPEENAINRSFGIVFTIFFIVLGLLPLLDKHSARIWALIVSAIFLMLAFIAPDTLTPLNRMWAKLGALLHQIVSPIALAILFFLIVTPIALTMRMRGKDPLRMKLERDLETYWIERTPPGPEAVSLKNQF